MTIIPSFFLDSGKTLAALPGCCVFLSNSDSLLCVLWRLRNCLKLVRDECRYWAE